MRIVRTRVTPRHAAAAVAAATIVAAGLALPAGLTAQLGAGVARTARLEVSTGSEAARTQFWSALDDFTSAYNFRASERMRAVVALDSTFGLARAFYAFGTGTLPRPEREAQLNRAVRDAATGSIGELLMATPALSEGVMYVRSSKSLFAIGKNEEAARYAGINTVRITIAAYVICCGLTAFNAILLAMYTRSISPAVATCWIRTGRP